jgi:hypothetical protein
VTSTTTTPRLTMDSLRGWMSGEDCVVMGCGPSLQETPLDLLQSRWTIGCNRSVLYHRPDFALCVEPPRDKEVWEAIRQASPILVFSHLEQPGRPHPRMVYINGKDVRKWWDPKHAQGDRLSVGQSPFMAAAAAAWLGFVRVGLIGVDLTKDRYGDTSVCGRMWGTLRTFLEGHGTTLVNLSPASRLETVPKADWAAIQCRRTA